MRKKEEKDCLNSTMLEQQKEEVTFKNPKTWKLFQNAKGRVYKNCKEQEKLLLVLLVLRFPRQCLAQMSSLKA